MAKKQRKPYTAADPQADLSRLLAALGYPPTLEGALARIEALVELAPVRATHVNPSPKVINPC